MPSSRGPSDPGIEPLHVTSLHWQEGSLSIAPPGKPIKDAYYALTNL